MPATSKTTIYIDLEKLGYRQNAPIHFAQGPMGLQASAPIKFADTRDGKVCEVVHWLGSVGINDYEVGQAERDDWMTVTVSPTDATAVVARFDPVSSQELAAYEDFVAKRTAFFEAEEAMLGQQAHMNRAIAHASAHSPLLAALTKAESTIERMMAEIEADLADRPPSRLRRILGWVKGWFR